MIMVDILVGQMFKSLIVGHFDLFGVPHRKIDTKRLTALGFIMIALLLMAVWRSGGCVSLCFSDVCVRGMSMLIDHFGWLGNSAMPLSEQRLGAILCLGIALYFIYSSGKTTEAKPIETTAAT